MDINYKINSIKSKMYKIIDSKGLKSDEALKISEELDVLIVEKQRQLSKLLC